MCAYATKFMLNAKWSPNASMGMVDFEAIVSS